MKSTGKKILENIAQVSGFTDPHTVPHTWAPVNLHREGAAAKASVHYSLIWGTLDVLLEIWGGMRFAHPIWCARQTGQTLHPETGRQWRDVSMSCCRFLPSLQPIASNSIRGQGGNALCPADPTTPSVPWEEQLFLCSWGSTYLNKERVGIVPLSELMMWTLFEKWLRLAAQGP